ncbi:mediator of RNA polymerase II transcription subunit [Thraustotheca clavata]|uniref:Mediator of RNA polymerase II transcription subunit 6 n=1 Tax=Thraustotheca clavata TaxID=74557 RepID=A0A1W0AAY6_9STRA|nr:mediator of RNA polymerase II transcription subunit [Thraustotheca clavata]
MDDPTRPSEAKHEDDYNTCFKDTVWLSRFELTSQTVMYYFYLSPFYDKNCNNARLMMQGARFEEMASSLVNMQGVEYELLPNLSNQVPQTLFIIRKQFRSSRNSTQTMAVYYCVDQTIYQAPNTFTMITSRLKKCSYRINKAFDALSSGVRFSPTEGYSWDFSTEDKRQPLIPSEQLALKLKRRQEKEEKTRLNSARVDSIVLNLVKKHAPEVIAAGAAALAPQPVELATATPAEDANPAPPKRQKV